MKKALVILILLSLISCDPFDNRLIINNKSNEDIYIKVANIVNDSIVSETMLSFGKVNTKSNIKTKIISTWESEFDNIYPDSTLTILIIYENLKTNPDILNLNLYLKKGQYEYVNYTISDFKSKDWIIEYPSREFLKGNKIINIDSTGNIIY
ncbi:MULTISPECIES: hypothetical protein [Flavobacterium]|uniref:Lipoprotein n=1 Tax=Flavobacterium jumunjinense TaxID=998845 RepID=A0ABV5GIU1_9FLAO|nr:MULTISPECIES: hypothetical protein [Flavobacterium]